MRKSFWIVFGIVGLFSQAAMASFDFSPVIVSLSPVGSKASTSFTLSNDADTKTPVQIYIVHRKPGIDGKEEYVETPDIDELFQVYPPQLILGPKERRTVRVTWTGSPQLKEEQAFRIIAEELPFSVEDPNKQYTKAVADVRLASKYVGSLYVTPPGAKSALAFKASTSDGKQLILDVANTGTEHQVLTGLKLTLTSEKGGTVEMPLDELKPLYNQNVLAGKKRQFQMTWPQSLPNGPVKVSFALPKE